MYNKKIITILKWDSVFFGYNIARITDRNIKKKFKKRIEKFFKKNKVKLVQFLCNCHNLESVNFAEVNGFNFKDIRITFQKKIEKKIRISVKKNLTLKKANINDIHILKKISSNLYKQSRYFFDNKFNKNKIKFFFETWVEKAVKGIYDDECLCLVKNKKIIAFCTLKYINKNIANIGLFSVSKHDIGKGNGKYLLSLIFNYLFKKKIKEITVVTQGRNYKAQNLYQVMGFNTKKTELWYHKWLRK